MKKSFINYAVLMGLGFVLIALRVIYTMVTTIVADHTDWKKLAAMLFALILVSVIGWLFIRIGLEKAKDNDGN
ncbi:MAG: membrane protein CcdC involved in cytochrome C biogenesis [Bacteroidia bacterium]|jgi:membrane protein CcdC involved in cytochrome C biogenesis